jgi:hypothetical protein
VHILSDGEHDPIIAFKWRVYQPGSVWAKKDGWRKLPHAMTIAEAQQWAEREHVDFEQHMVPTEEAGVIEPFFPLESWGSPDSRGRP